MNTHEKIPQGSYIHIQGPNGKQIPDNPTPFRLHIPSPRHSLSGGDHDTRRVCLLQMILLQVYHFRFSLIHNIPSLVQGSCIHSHKFCRTCPPDPSAAFREARRPPCFLHAPALQSSGHQQAFPLYT